MLNRPALRTNLFLLSLLNPIQSKFKHLSRRKPRKRRKRSSSRAPILTIRLPLPPVRFPPIQFILLFFPCLPTFHQLQLQLTLSNRFSNLFVFVLVLSPAARGNQLSKLACSQQLVLQESIERIQLRERECGLQGRGGGGVQFFPFWNESILVVGGGSRRDDLRGRPREGGMIGLRCCRCSTSRVLLLRTAKCCE